VKAMTGARADRILVVGLGNLLLADEGVGIHAIRELEKRDLPAHVDVIDGGTAGLDLLDLLIDYRLVIIVDAVNAGQQPGTIFRFGPEDITAHADHVPLSLHQTQLANVLQLATYLGQPLPPIVIYGVQPETMDWGTELSSALEAKMARLIDAILEEISGHEE
jgi:hydrogenase maturation protease